MWTHIYTYTDVNKLHWQSGGIITLEAGNIAISDTEIADVFLISFFKIKNDMKQKLP